MGRQWLILVVLLCGTRLAYRFAKTAARRARAGAQRPAVTREVPVLLYGAGPLAALYVGAVRSTPGTNVRVVGIIEDAGTPRGRYVHDVPVLGGPEDLDRIVAELAVQGIHPERLVLTRSAERLPLEVRAFAERCRARHGVELHFLPDLLGVPSCAITSDPASASGASERAYFRVRRPVEVSLSALGLLVLMPLVGLIALLVLVDRARLCCSVRCAPAAAIARSRCTSFVPCAIPATSAARPFRTRSGRLCWGAFCAAPGSTSCRS
jgi:hypothetical protein